MATTEFSQFARTGRQEGIDMDATWTTAWYASGTKTGCSIQVHVTNADSVGVLKVQGANDTDHPIDLEFQDSAGTVFTELTVASATDVNHLYQIPALTFGYLRVVYTRTSGGAADSAKVKLFCKGV